MVEAANFTGEPIYTAVTSSEPLLFPSEKDVRILLTSEATLSTWVLPGLGVEIDLCPGIYVEIPLKLWKSNFAPHGVLTSMCDSTRHFPTSQDMVFRTHPIAPEIFTGWMESRKVEYDLKIKNAIPVSWTEAFGRLFRRKVNIKVPNNNPDFDYYY